MRQEDAAGETSEANEEKLNPIRALLYGLDQLSSITVVTATTTLRMRFDIEKIARYVEVLPELAGPRIGGLLALFRTGCVEVPNIIDPAAPELRGQLNALGTAGDYGVRRLIWSREVYDATDALCMLCVTPRAIKQALRACLDTWRRLPGEIDFDDVLVLCIIRETQPDAFAAIRDHIYYLRDGQRARPDEQRQAQTAWGKSLNAVPMDDRQRAAVDYLVKFVFGEQDAWQKPQGVARHYHADYWERFLAIPKLREGERDQPVLQTLLQEDDAAVLDLLQSGPPRSAAVEDFERLISRDRLVGLFLPLVERRSEERPDSWGGQEPPGLIPLWRMWNRRCERGELPAATVLDHVKRAFDIAIPRNLGLVTDIEAYFVVSSQGVPQLLGPAERMEAKEYCRGLFASTYRDRGQALSMSLKGAKTPTLLWLCWGLDRVRSREVAGVPFTEWPGLVPAVVEAVRHDPQVMLPQVACLVVRESVVIARRSGLQYDFDQDAATRLFGNVETVLDLFRGQDAAHWTDSPPVGTVLAYLQT